MGRKRSFVQTQRFLNSKTSSSRREDRRFDEQEEKRKRRAVFNALPEAEKAEILRKNQIVQRIQRNGITIDDLKENYDIGYKAGFENATGPVIKTCYAAICLALHELHGFGMKRCRDVLNLVDQKILYSLTSAEAIEEVWEKIGLQIDFGEILDDRITEVEAQENA